MEETTLRLETASSRRKPSLRTSKHHLVLWNCQISNMSFKYETWLQEGVETGLVGWFINSSLGCC